MLCSATIPSRSPSAREGAARFADVGDREGASFGLANSASALVHLGDPDLAATLWAVSTRIHSELGLPLGSDEEEVGVLLEQLLPPTRFAELVTAADTPATTRRSVSPPRLPLARFDTDSAAR